MSETEFFSSSSSTPLKEDTLQKNVELASLFFSYCIGSFEILAASSVVQHTMMLEDEETPRDQVLTCQFTFTIGDDEARMKAKGYINKELPEEALHRNSRVVRATPSNVRSAIIDALEETLHESC